MSGPRQANLSKMYEPQAVGRSGLVLLLEPVRRLSSHKVVYFGLWQVFRATLRQWASRVPRVQLRSWRSKHTKDPFWHREGLGCMLELRDVTHLVCGRLVVFGASFILAHTPFCPCLQRFFGSVRRASGHELYQSTRQQSRRRQQPPELPITCTPGQTASCVDSLADGQEYVSLATCLLECSAPWPHVKAACGVRRGQIVSATTWSVGVGS